MPPADGNPLNPRAVIAQSCEFACPIWRLEAKRKASGSLVAPDLCISFPVITWTADATSVNFSGRIETEVTSISINSSRLNLFNERDDNKLSWLKHRSGNNARPGISIAIESSLYRVRFGFSIFILSESLHKIKNSEARGQSIRHLTSQTMGRIKNHEELTVRSVS